MTKPTPHADYGRCAIQDLELIEEPGGPEMPTIHGRRYCPACQDTLNKALDEAAQIDRSEGS